MLANKRAQQTETAGGFHALALKVMLGVAEEAFKAGVVANRDIFFEVFKYALEEIGSLTSHAAFDLFSDPDRTRQSCEFYALCTLALRLATLPHMPIQKKAGPTDPSSKVSVVQKERA